MRLRPGLRSRLHWGSLRCSPDPLVGWGGGYPLLIPTPNAFGVPGVDGASTQCPGTNSEKSAPMQFCVHFVANEVQSVCLYSAVLAAMPSFIIYFSTIAVIFLWFHAIAARRC